MTNDDEVMQEVEALAGQMQALITQVSVYLDERDKNEANTQNVNPMRWLNEGRTDLQKGLMCIRRAIEKPQGF